MATQLNEMLEKLPPFSPSVKELMAAVRDDTRELAELDKVLVKCPVIAGRVLQIANSSFFGFSRQIHSLREACVILGKRTLEGLVYTLAITDHFKGDGSDKGLIDYSRIWQSSLFSACLAQTLGKHRKPPVNNLFIGGLFLHFGLIIVDFFDRPQLERIIELALENSLSLEDASAQVLGLSYIQLTAQALESWHFPQDVCDAISGCGDGASTIGASTIWVSHIIAQALGYITVAGVFPAPVSQTQLNLACPDAGALPEILAQSEALFNQMSTTLLGG